MIAEEIREYFRMDPIRNGLAEFEIVDLSTRIATRLLRCP